MELFGMITTDCRVDREKHESFLLINPTPLFERMVYIDENVDRMSVKNDDGLKIYRIKVVLNETDPLVWRRIQVPSSLSLSNLHSFIQHAMGWTNSHLHEFEKEGVCYTDYLDEELPAVLYDGMCVSDLLKEKGEKIIYRYDFGDDWEHTLELEELFTPDEGMDYRVFLDGERRCPPEDCGGVSGYYEMLRVLNDPTNPEREDYLVWLGGPYDPESYQAPIETFRFRVEPEL
jgi:hypothetical protein